MSDFDINDIFEQDPELAKVAKRIRQTYSSQKIDLNPMFRATLRRRLLDTALEYHNKRQNRWWHSLGIPGTIGVGMAIAGIVLVLIAVFGVIQKSQPPIMVSFINVPQTGKLTSLVQPIKLTFSGHINKTQIASNVELKPAVKYKTYWQGNTLYIVPEEPLSPATQYSITVNAAEPKGTKTITLSFYTPGDGSLVPIETISVGSSTLIATANSNTQVVAMTQNGQGVYYISAGSNQNLYDLYFVSTKPGSVPVQLATNVVYATQSPNANSIAVLQNSNGIYTLSLYVYPQSVPLQISTNVLPVAPVYTTSGDLLYAVQSAQGSEIDVVEYDPATGNNTAVFQGNLSPTYGNLILSPNGYNLLYTSNLGTYLYNFTHPNNPTFVPINGIIKHAVFSPDGNYAAAIVQGALGRYFIDLINMDNPTLSCILSDDGNEPQPLTTGCKTVYSNNSNSVVYSSLTWAPDDNFITFLRSDRFGHNSIWAYSLQNHILTSLTFSPEPTSTLAWSPQLNQVAYSANDAVYVANIYPPLTRHTTFYQSAGEVLNNFLEARMLGSVQAAQQFMDANAISSAKRYGIELVPALPYYIKNFFVVSRQPLSDSSTPAVGYLVRIMIGKGSSVIEEKDEYITLVNQGNGYTINSIQNGQTVTNPTSPSIISIAGSESGVLNVAALFDADLNRSTVNTQTVYLLSQNGTPVPIKVTASSRDIHVVSTETLTPGETYTLTFTSGIKDTQGYGMASNFNWNFTSVMQPTQSSSTSSNS